MKRATTISILLLAALLTPGTALLAANKDLKIAMVQWRGDTEACEAFRNGMKELGYKVRQLAENPEAPVLEKTDQDMSALFVDVSGYTKLSEDIRQTADFMVEKYFSRYLDVIHAHGGDVTETSGDGLMVVFPGNDPKEHALNAVKAALEIFQRTEELNTQLKGVFDPISVHIGINSGIALIGPTKYEGASGARWAYTALGPAINLAARIAGVAEGGMICAGPETARRIDGYFATKEIGKKQLKNVKSEVMIHRVLGATEASS